LEANIITEILAIERTFYSETCETAFLGESEATSATGIC